MLLSSYTTEKTEAGCDEAGRGCLAGPVVAACVILPKNFFHKDLNDSKKLSPKKRDELRTFIEKNALDCEVAFVDNIIIDKINILNASFKAMNEAINKLKLLPEILLIDGNRFKNTTNIPHICIVKGDSKYASIAAASILAKTYRDQFMKNIHNNYPEYDWKQNKGYPTPKHIKAINDYGLTPYHRRSFNNCQTSLFNNFY